MKLSNLTPGAYARWATIERLGGTKENNLFSIKPNKICMPIVRGILELSSALDADFREEHSGASEGGHAKRRLTSKISGKPQPAVDLRKQIK